MEEDMKKEVPKYKVYDEVWIMRNNRPVEMVVFAAIQSMNHFKTGVDMNYRLVNSAVGAGFGNNSGILMAEADIFETKQALLDSL